MFLVHQPPEVLWLFARHAHAPVLAVLPDGYIRQALVCIVFLLAYYKGGFNRSEFPVHRLPRAGYFRTPQVRAQPWAGRTAALQMGEKRLEIGGEEADGDGEEDDTEKNLLVPFLTNSQVFLESSNLAVRTALVRANRGTGRATGLYYRFFQID